MKLLLAALALFASLSAFGAPVTAFNGGTGVANNNANTITLASPLVKTGTDSLTFTTTGASVLTVPVGTKTLVATDVATLSSLTSIGTLTSLNLSGQLTSSYANPGTSGISLTASTGTNGVGAIFSNTGGDFYIGKDNSTGGNITGTAYGNYIWGTSTRSLDIGTNNLSRVNIDGSTGVLYSGYGIQSVDYKDGSGNLIISSTNPTIASGFGSGATITANNTAAFKIVTGSSASSTGAVTMPTAANGWACSVTDSSGTSTYDPKAYSINTTTVNVDNIRRSDNAVTTFLASHALYFMCAAF